MVSCCFARTVLYWAFNWFVFSEYSAFPARWVLLNNTSPSFTTFWWLSNTYSMSSSVLSQPLWPCYES